MSLRDSRIINEVHPWLGARLRWLGEVARIYGTVQSLISGNRTERQQLALYDAQGSRPAAYPGCSQHQYGFAADATYLPLVLISSKGKPIVFSHQETTAAMNSAARHVGLTLVSGDDGHYQIYPGIQFRSWAVSRGLCPANPPPPVGIGESFPLVGGRVDLLCGTGFTGYQIREGHVTCLPQSNITSLPGE